MERRGIVLVTMKSLGIGLASAPAFLLPLCRAQDISIIGIKPGQSMEEARSRLTGYSIVNYPSQANGRIQIIAGTKAKMDDVLVETADDKVAYVSRELFLKPADSPSFNTYHEQLVQKFGPESIVAWRGISERDAREMVFDRSQGKAVVWNFDVDGKLIHYGACGDFQKHDLTAPLQSEKFVDLDQLHIGSVHAVFGCRGLPITQRTRSAKLPWVAI